MMPKSAWRASPMPLTAQPQHRDLDRVLIGFQALLDFGDDGRVTTDGPASEIRMLEARADRAA